jgi:hypothetical protein
MHKKSDIYFFCLDWIANSSKRLACRAFDELAVHGFLEKNTNFIQGLADHRNHAG